MIANNPDELRSDRRGACQIVADRGPDVLGKQKTPDLRTITHRMSWFYRNLQKVTPKESLVGRFWVTFDTKTARSCDKPGHRSHHSQDFGKHNVFDGPGAQTS